jgi:hypothetical protein
MAIKTSFAGWVAGAAVSAVGLWSISAFAVAAPAVPASLTQQGRILDATTGDPVASKLKLVFNVYADAKGGTALWTEEQDLTLDDGYFSAQLGSVTPIPDTLFDGTVRYLGVTVGADDEMAPREAITSVPYAMKAAVADVANGAAFTSLTGIPAPCADGSYLTGYSAAGVAACSTLPALSCTYRANTAATGTSASAGCDTASGESLMGGGCYDTVPLNSSYPDVCPVAALDVTPGAATGVTPAAVIGPIKPPIIIPIGCFASGKWTCSSASSGTIRAYAVCCSVK